MERVRLKVFKHTHVPSLVDTIAVLGRQKVLPSSLLYAHWYALGGRADGMLFSLHSSFPRELELTMLEVLLGYLTIEPIRLP